MKHNKKIFLIVIIFAALLILFFIAFTLNHKEESALNEEKNEIVETIEQKADEDKDTGNKEEEKTEITVQKNENKETILTVSSEVEEMSDYEFDDSSSETEKTQSSTEEKKESIKDSKDEKEAEEPKEEMKWEEFYALSPEEKDAYLDSYEDYSGFVDWMNKAQEQFKKDYPDIQLGADGSFDLNALNDQ